MIIKPDSFQRCNQSTDKSTLPYLWQVPDTHPCPEREQSFTLCSWWFSHPEGQGDEAVAASGVKGQGARVTDTLPSVLQTTP